MEIKNQNELVLITEVQPETRGDVTSAFKLIRAMLAQNPNRPILWLLHSEDKVMIDELPPQVNLVCISDWKLLFEYHEQLKSAAMVSIYPAYVNLSVTESRADVSFLPRIVLRFVECCRKNKLPLTPILEYGYMEPALFEKVKIDFPDCHFVQTGVMKDGCGIVLEDYSEKRPYQHLVSLSDNVKELLGRDLIDDASYLTTHALFLGYYNRDVERVVNKHVNAVNYIHIVSELAPKDIRVNNKSCVDIMLPFSLAEMSQLNTDKIFALGYSSVSFMAADGQENLYASSSSKGPRLRIVQLPKVSPAVFRSLVAIAHPFVMCTGDQSLSEVISKGMAGEEEGYQVDFGMPYYQIMHWKLTAFAQLFEQIQAVCGEDSFYTMAIKSLIVDVDIKILGDYYGSYQFWWDGQKFAAYVKRYFDLAVNLPKYIEACIAANRMLELSDVLPQPSTKESDYMRFKINNGYTPSFSYGGRNFIHTDKPDRFLESYKRIKSDSADSESTSKRKI